jgi:hypothetical protein
MKNYTDKYNKYKYEGVPYTRQEVKSSRLVAKDLNGMVFMTDAYLDMYPDATTVALVRNGLATYESRKRRGRAPSVRDYASMYDKVVKKMINDSEKFENYYVIRFEDILNDPMARLSEVYEYVGLDIRDLKKVRLKVKPHLDEKGHWGTPYSPKEKIWLGFEELTKYIEPKINKYHINNISEQEKNDFLEIAKDSMEYFSYTAHG